MSPWEPYVSQPKRPPPKRGIKMKKSGSTWWGQRWVAALERVSIGYSGRLARGRTYARAGRTHDLTVEDCKVTAKVTGSRRAPYKVTLTFLPLPDEVWAKAIAAMTEKAQFSAELLAGRMPQEIDAAFKAADVSLFPAGEADLTTKCSCPDWANPCKHVAATHYVLGEAFDRDPFLLFELRGRSKQRVLAALRAVRAELAEPLPGSRDDTGGTGSASAVLSVTLGRIKASDWDPSPERPPSLRLSFEAPPTSGALLRQLGVPAGWSSRSSPAEALGPMIRAAAERARSIAMAEPDVAPAVPEALPVARGARSRQAPRGSAGSQKVAKKASKKVTKKVATTTITGPPKRSRQPSPGRQGRRK